MRESDAYNLIARLAGSLTGFDDVSVEAYADRLVRLEDPARLGRVVAHVVDTWDEARRPPLKILLDGYEALERSEEGPRVVPHAVDDPAAGLAPAGDHGPVFGRRALILSEAARLMGDKKWLASTGTPLHDHRFGPPACPRCSNVLLRERWGAAIREATRRVLDNTAVGLAGIPLPGLARAGEELPL